MDGIGSSLDRGIGINMGLEFESHSMGSGIGSLAPYLGHITHLPDRTLSLNSPTNCSWLFCPVLLVKLLLELLPLMEMLLVRSMLWQISLGGNNYAPGNAWNDARSSASRSESLTITYLGQYLPQIFTGPRLRRAGPWRDGTQTLP